MSAAKNIPMAVCHIDDEPLIFTFEFPGYEFMCVICKTKYEFFGPKSATWTQELQNRHDELRVQYEEERKQREEMAT